MGVWWCGGGGGGGVVVVVVWWCGGVVVVRWSCIPTCSILGLRETYVPHWAQYVSMPCIKHAEDVV